MSYTFPLTVSMHPPGFGIYWYRRHDYVRKREEYGRTKDKSLLARQPCFYTDEFRRPVAQALRKGIPPLLKYSPLAYYMADESSVTCYEDAFDLCWAPATLVEFRKWLRGLYRTLDALNAEWGTKYREWAKVMPATWEEAQARGNPAPWVDHRLFMNRSLVSAFQLRPRRGAAASTRRGWSPSPARSCRARTTGATGGRWTASCSTCSPTRWAGRTRCTGPSTRRCCSPASPGMRSTASPLEYEIWHRFLHGHCGASIFWGYTFVDPDLTLNAAGTVVREDLRRAARGGPVASGASPHPPA